MLAAVPTAARLLGLAGLIPFWAPVLILATAADPALRLDAQRALLAYGAVILAFLGAVHWGAALRMDRGASDWRRLGWSVLPSLIGWVALLLASAAGLVLLILGLVAAFVVDLRAVRDGMLPGWYAALRRALTIGALSALVLALLLPPG